MGMGVGTQLVRTTSLPMHRAALEGGLERRVPQTVRVAVTQKLREKIPRIAAVQLLES